MGENNDPSRSPAPYVPPGVITPLPVAIPGAVTPDQLQATQDAQRKISEATSRIAGIDKGLSAAGAATDADYVRTEDRFRDRTHEELYAAVHGDGEGQTGLDAAGLRQLHQTWSECSSGLENLSTFNLLGMNNIFNHGLWQGVSGSAAQAASERFAHAANEIGQVFDSVSQRLETLSWAAEAVRAAVHPPPTSSVAVSPDPDNPAESLIPGLINPDYQHNLEAQRKNARDEAIRALETLYKPNFPPAGSGVPAYTPVPQVGPGDSVPPGNSYPGGPTARSNVPGLANDRGTDGTDAPADQPDQQNEQQTDPKPATPNQTPTPTTKPAGVGLPTSLPGSEVTGAQTTAAGLGSSATAADPASVSRSSGPSFHGGSGPAAGTARGEARTSRPGVTGTVNGDAGRSVSASARPGTPLGGGMPHGAGKGKTEEEREHRLPDYLRGIQSEWTDGLDSPVGVIDTDLVTDAPRPYDTDAYNPPQFTQPSTPTPPPYTEAALDSNYRPTRAPVHSPHQPITPPQQEDATQTTRHKPNFASPPAAATQPPAPPVVQDIAAPPVDEPAESGITPELAGLFAEYGWSKGSSESDSTVANGQGLDDEKPSGAGQ